MLNSEERIEKFISEIDEELGARKKDLNNLRSIIDTTMNLNNKFTLIRNTFPTIYAHYEGFLKYSFWKVIDYIKDSSIGIDDLNPNFIILCLVPSLESHLVRQVSKSQAMLSVFNKVFTMNENIFNVMEKDKYVINHDTLKSTCDLIGINLSKETIPEKEFPMKELGIIYSRRNGIAHGELSPKRSEMFALIKSSSINSKQVESADNVWNESYTQVLKALDLLKDIFLDYLINEEYKAN